MKSQPLRKEKNCLNCGTEVPERYCTHCGQENAVQHETFGHLVKHFVADVLHYDSQFLLTLKYLLFRPGYLSREYMAGKRVRYVNPIKLYIFVSFVFFFGVFAFSHKESEKEPQRELTAQERQKIDSIVVLNSSGIAKSSVDWVDVLANVNSIQAFDSIQHALPDSLKLAGTQKVVLRRLVEMKQKHGNNLGEAFIEIFQHNLPKMMFILLPLFALLMKLFYDRSKWLYVDHAIFTIHLHSFAFILALLAFLFGQIFHTGIFLTFSYWIIFIYLVLALRNNYHQSYPKSMLKGILLLTAYLFSASLLLLGYVLLILTIFL
ncbi:DUF3667 domain-containing protein [Chitinophaga sp. 212800010-3]|uniref:DUF3667 domain-containing protein n=1 Tax=unclassified Chitinophaga TaxID=2619133 RepID=UPI002DF2E7E6|nr:DUF3667 domain-containing protein [Chitinophaga sp. 212800010-3]